MTDAVVEIPIFAETPADVARRITEPRRGATHRDAVETEIIAALRNLPRSGTQRRRVLEAIAAAGDAGCSDYQLECDLAEPVYGLADNGEQVIVSGGMRRPSPGNRRGELEDDGLVVFTGEHRATNTGSPARVHRITDKGVAVLAELRRLDL